MAIPYLHSPVFISDYASPIHQSLLAPDGHDYYSPYGPRFQSPPKPVYPLPSAYITPPTTPDTPCSSYSRSTSPPSTASPPTPLSMEHCTARIVLVSSSSGILKHDPASSTASFESQDVRLGIAISVVIIWVHRCRCFDYQHLPSFSLS